MLVLYKVIAGCMTKITSEGKKGFPVVDVAWER